MSELLRFGRFAALLCCSFVLFSSRRGEPQAAGGTVPMGMEADEITPEVARALLALPRTVGTHLETGKDILAGVGRYGPWLKHGAAYVPLPEDEDVLAVGLNRAVVLVDTA